MNNKQREKIKDKVSLLPTTSGVYSMHDAHGNIVYIGKAKNLKRRVSSYFLANLKHEKVRQMMTVVHDFDYVVTASELDALTLESNLVHKHMPFYNILLKDGKAFPYLKINLKEDFPRVVLTRKIKKDGALYFGPFFGKVRIADLMQIISHTFPIRDCALKISEKSKPKRVCLNYHIGKCLAPCGRNVSKEDYRKVLDNVISFLKGDTALAKSILTEKMMNCASLQQFEKAMEFKESLKLIDNLNNLIITDITKLKDIDVFGFSTNEINSAISLLCVRGGKMIGVSNFNITESSDDSDELIEGFITQYYVANNIVPEIVICGIYDDALHGWLKEKRGKSMDLISPKRGVNARLLEMAEENAKVHLEKNLEKEKLHKLRTLGAVNKLQELLNLEHPPVRIEGFDISNLGGTNTVASMVVFENGQPNKKHYRKFKIEADGQNDFEAMRQVLERRINNLNSDDISFAKLPNLILIDGGKGQLSFAYSVLKNVNLNIPIISLAEKNEEVFLPNISKPIVLNRNNYALQLLQNIRDESHRFAVTFQRNVRTKSTLASELSKIDLIGEEKIKELFKHFKSLPNIKKASKKELMQVKGIGAKLAENIYNYFNARSSE